MNGKDTSSGELKNETVDEWNTDHTIMLQMCSFFLLNQYFKGTKDL